jgi:ankyrin repeat protein
MPIARKRNGYTALMFATFNGNTDIIQALLDNGADLDLKTKNGTTALKLAEMRGYSRTADFLKQHGAKE